MISSIGASLQTLGAPNTPLWIVHSVLAQGYVKERLKLSLRKFYGRYGDLIKHYEVSLSQMLNDIL